MDICAAQQPTWHPGKRGCPSAHLLYIHFPCRLFNIYIPWNSDVLQRFIKTIVFLVWCLIPNQFYQINVCCDALNSSTLFSQIGRVSTWLLYIRWFAPSWINAMAYLKWVFYLQFLVLSKISHGKMCSYNIIQIHFVITGIHNCQHKNR